MFVLDASTIIEFKDPDLVPWDRQWDFLRCLEGMVRRGQVQFPKMVLDELQNVQHLDAPGAWALGVFKLQEDGFQPANDLIDAVRDLVPDVIDPEAEEDDADPAVIAHAVYLHRLGYQVVVVTKDAGRDQGRLSLVGACAQINPPVMTMDPVEFIAASGCLSPEARP